MLLLLLIACTVATNLPNEPVWDTGEWIPMSAPCATCRSRGSRTIIQRQTLNEEKGIADDEEDKPVQLVYLPEGSINLLSAAKLLKVSQESPLISTFSDKQKRDHSGFVVAGSPSNALAMTLVAAKGQEADAKEKLRLLEQALKNPSSGQASKDNLPKVFIAPSHVPPPPGYVKIPLVPQLPHNLQRSQPQLPGTFLTPDDRSPPPPGFIRLHLPENVSHLSQKIPVVVPNNQIGPQLSFNPIPLAPTPFPRPDASLNFVPSEDDHRKGKNIRPNQQSIQVIPKGEPKGIIAQPPIEFNQNIPSTSRIPSTLTPASPIQRHSTTTRHPNLPNSQNQPPLFSTGHLESFNVGKPVILPSRPTQTVHENTEVQQPFISQPPKFIGGFSPRPQNIPGTFPSVINNPNQSIFKTPQRIPPDFPLLDQFPPSFQLSPRPPAFIPSLNNIPSSEDDIPNLSNKQHFSTIPSHGFTSRPFQPTLQPFSLSTNDFSEAPLFSSGLFPVSTSAILPSPRPFSLGQPFQSSTLTSQTPIRNTSPQPRPVSFGSIQNSFNEKTKIPISVTSRPAFESTENSINEEKKPLGEFVPDTTFPSVTRPNPIRVTTFKPKFQFRSRTPIAPSLLPSTTTEPVENAATLFPPFSVARTLSSGSKATELQSLTDNKDIKSSKPSFGRRLRPRTRNPVSDGSVSSNSTNDIPEEGRRPVVVRQGFRRRPLSPNFQNEGVARPRLRFRSRQRINQLENANTEEFSNNQPADENDFTAAESAIVIVKRPLSKAFINLSKQKEEKEEKLEAENSEAEKNEDIYTTESSYTDSSSLDVIEPTTQSFLTTEELTSESEDFSSDIKYVNTKSFLLDNSPDVHDITITTIDSLNADSVTVHDGLLEPKHDFKLHHYSSGIDINNVHIIKPIHTKHNITLTHNAITNQSSFTSELIKNYTNAINNNFHLNTDDTLSTGRRSYDNYDSYDDYIPEDNAFSETDPFIVYAIPVSETPDGYVELTTINPFNVVEEIVTDSINDIESTTEIEFVTEENSNSSQANKQKSPPYTEVKELVNHFQDKTSKKPTEFKPLHVRLQESLRALSSSSVGTSKVIGESTVTEIRHSDPVICFKSGRCVNVMNRIKRSNILKI